MAGNVTIGGGGSVHVDRKLNGKHCTTEIDVDGKVGQKLTVTFPGEANQPAVVVKIKQGATVVVTWPT